MHARIVGPEEEVGEVLKPVTVFGHKVGRDWSEVNFSPDQVAKLNGNRYVELKGHEHPKAAPVEVEKAEPVAPMGKSEVIEKLTELGVSFDPKAPVAALRETLANAQQAQAKADQED